LRIAELVDRYLPNPTKTRILDARFSEIICSRMATRKPYSITHSVLNLAHPVSEPFTPRLLQQTISQVKTFIFAGEDTTSTVVQWMIYNISKHPRVLTKLRAEHDSIFGDQSAEEALSERPKEVLAAMVYSTAVVKETLRLNPPAATARAAPEGSGFEVAVGGKRMRLDGTMLYVNHDIIHRNEKVRSPRPIPQANKQSSVKLPNPRAAHYSIGAPQPPNSTPNAGFPPTSRTSLQQEHSDPSSAVPAGASAKSSP
jgi:hypothetical protein